jgi:YegS/Rv2252/BmrU family lipid kinase
MRGKIMGRKKACLVINPRSGQNVANITAVLAVLAAANWRTDIEIKEYGGQAIQLAEKAAEKGYELIIAYGGDGTLSQVVNGVMNTKGQHSMVGLIPGGTANVWAGEISVPADPVKAALTLISSECRLVDIGHIEVESLSFPAKEQNGTQKVKHKGKAKAKAKHHFLLMSGMGIDAAIMGHVSKPLKYRLGTVAVGLSAAKELPAQHPFSIEIRANDSGHEDEVLWKGEALQVVIGNTRRYADIVEMTPDAYIDDGILDICIFNSGDPLTTMQQAASLLLRRKPDRMTAKYIHGAHFSITIPVSVALQLDGSAVKLKDYLSKADRAALAQVDNTDNVMVTYRFDVMHQALQAAIPSSYNNVLFEHTHEQLYTVMGETPQTGDGEQQQTNSKTEQTDVTQTISSQQINTLLENGYTVTLIGAVQQAGEPHVFIAAGTTIKQQTGEMKPVAVRIDGNTTMVRRTGEHVSTATILNVQEGQEIVVEGDKDKRGVILATRIVI